MAEAKPDPSYVNPRGIPQAIFVDNVDEFVKSRDQVEALLKQFQETLQKYQYMEQVRATRLANVNDKIPDIEKTLEMVKFLDSKKESGEAFTTNYELNDTLYAKATVTASDKVCLWLGANVMLEYTTEEAIELLQGKLDGAKKTQQECEEDLEFLRENITTMQVNTARIYNWDIAKRREEKLAAEAK